MKKSITMAQLAKEGYQTFAGSGFCAPEREHWGDVERAMRERATKVVNGLLGSVVKAYVKQATPFLVAELVSSLFASVRIEFDDKGPFVRLNAEPEEPKEEPCGS